VIAVVHGRLGRRSYSVKKADQAGHDKRRPQESRPVRSHMGPLIAGKTVSGW
jgi:hypothetical protein